MILPEPLEVLIEELNKLPSIGKKTAQRLALFLLRSDDEYIAKFITAIGNIKKNIKICTDCYNISTSEVCEICSSNKRDKSIICVVEDISDIIAVEKTNEYNGLYHVLGGVLSPLSGKDVESIRLKELIDRIRNSEVKEILLALNPDTEGETTSLYIAKLLKEFNVKVTRIARGLPVGGNLEFADEATVGRAVLNRITLQ
ncbi:MAG: recombination protein RecR [Ignavibacteriae bacterium HGW-Ignavibacteriae-2]|nr:recombination mediator RecR [Bacteroidota bacterium]PKL88585.1 MAG: recombination protein RecR [Ignavibacteriae bacterium HGW-Ignavibacteriae-2]